MSVTDIRAAFNFDRYLAVYPALNFFLHTNIRIMREADEDRAPRSVFENEFFGFFFRDVPFQNFGDCKENILHSLFPDLSVVGTLQLRTERQQRQFPQVSACKVGNLTDKLS